MGGGMRRRSAVRSRRSTGRCRWRWWWSICGRWRRLESWRKWSEKGQKTEKQIPRSARDDHPRAKKGGAVNRTESTIAERIERLPLGGFHRRFIALVSLGNFFDLYDIFIVAYIGAALQQSGFLSLRQFTFFVAAGFLGMFVGTVVFGMGSDRMGRRSAFILLLLIYSVFTFADAFAPTAAWLIALRFFAGVGIGAEIVVIDTYVTEMVPGRARGRYVAITQVAGFCAVPVAAVLSRLLVPTHFLMSGWRWVMVIGASGALLTWWFRRRLPESPRWLESQRRIAEADAIMSGLEKESFSGAGRSGQQEAKSGSLAS